MLLKSGWHVVTAGSHSKRWSQWLVWPGAKDQDSVQWVARDHVHSAVAPGSGLLGQEHRRGGCQIECFSNHGLVVDFLCWSCRIADSGLTAPGVKLLIMRTNGSQGK